ALADFMQPDRVVIGAHRREAADLVAKLYEPLNAPILLTTIYTAEMIKYASNSFLATRISFINEMARICERVDADVKVVSEGMGLDRRIGSLFLEAGIGYGGSCFPKDVKALAATAKEYGYHPELLRAVMDINQDQQRLVIEKLKDCLGTLRGRSSACSASPSSPTPTTCGRPPAWRSPAGSSPKARRCAPTTRPRWSAPSACCRTSTTAATLTRWRGAPTPSR